MANVTLSGVSKRFGPSVAVEALDISIPDGTFAAFLGPSGCGKTTTLRMIAGLETPSGGTIRIGEQTVFGEGVHVPTERRRIGMVFQSYAVWPHMTVADNVAFPLRIARVPRGEAAERVRAALATVRLDALAGRYPGQLSGGQQQRVALARAIVAEPRLLLLDEPLSNLDARLRDEMRDEIRDLHRRLKVTALYVTHDQTEALALADVVFVMDHGRLQQAGPPREINERPANRFVADFVGWANILPAGIAGPSAVLLAGREVSCAVPGGMAPGTAVAVAIRPEDVVVTGAPDTAHLAGLLEGLTYLGRSLAADISVGGVRIRAHLPTDSALQPGQPVGVTLPAERLRILPA
jgi:ABC-type Fe3+/spermidine/putrescine transport system ATPase subunit